MTTRYLLLLATSLLLAAGCSSDGGSQTTDGGTDAAVTSRCLDAATLSALSAHLAYVDASTTAIFRR